MTRHLMPHRLNRKVTGPHPEEPPPDTEPAAAPDETGRPAGRTLRWPVIAALFAAAVLVVFADTLLNPSARLLSMRGTDLHTQFVPWRDFAARELRAGHFPLWNPHVFSGMPFFAGFQSAMLYPPNALFLLLPLPLAINLSVALHVLAAGLFTYAWLRRRRLSRTSAFLGGMAFMFCGQHFLHITAGHLPNLCAIPWIPLIFLSLDAASNALLARRFRRAGLWTLAGGACVALEILAGHPQYVFYTAVTVALYAALLMALQRNVLLPLSLAAMYGVGLLLTAVQILPGLAAARESVRSGGVPYSFAAMFSLPPENLLTLLVPGFFGDIQRVAYWGRCYLWEMSLFLGLVPLVLALSAATGWRRGPRAIPATLAVLTLLLALGGRTPLFRLLYDWVPGFDLFRGSSKFAVFTHLFLILLACGELDRIRRLDRLPRAAVVVALLLASATCALAVVLLMRSPAGTMDAWASFMRLHLPRRETYLSAELYLDPGFIAAAAHHATLGLLFACLMLIAIGGTLVAMPRVRYAALILVAVASLELIAFARRNRPTFPIADAMPPSLPALVRQDPGEYRVLNPDNPNAAMRAGAFDLWGIDPGVSKRYAELIAWSQGYPPDNASQYVNFRQLHPALSMLRCRYVIQPPAAGERDPRISRLPGDLPRIFLAGGYRVASGRDAVLRLMEQPGFNPLAEVILEEIPRPEPQPSADSGSVRILEQDTDRILLEAALNTPALLVMTDGYATGWRARPQSHALGQSTYTILPANYALRAIPLQAGFHRIVMEYRPPEFDVGLRISAGTLAAALLACAALAWPRRTS